MEKAIVLAISGLSAALTISVAAFAAAFGDARVASKALEGMTRQPELSGKLLTNMLIAIGLVESIPIIAAVIAIVLVFANPYIGLL